MQRRTLGSETMAIDRTFLELTPFGKGFVWGLQMQEADGCLGGLIYRRLPPNICF